MNTEFMEKKQLVYELMNGTWDLELLPVPEGKLVKDEFAKGEPCEVMYRNVYKAAKHICERLNVKEDDEDITTVINGMFEIMRYTALKMYDYGQQFAEQEKK